ncbi:hypothetical protein ACJX0J_039670, partial [Zea mays]
IFLDEKMNFFIIPLGITKKDMNMTMKDIQIYNFLYILLGLGLTCLIYGIIVEEVINNLIAAMDIISGDPANHADEDNSCRGRMELPFGDIIAKITCLPQFCLSETLVRRYFSNLL